MKNWMKRGLSLLLVMAMVFGFIPMGMVTSAKAAEEGKATLLQDAAGVVWLVKAESGAYAPASTELINMLMDEQLDDMIRDAVGEDREDDSVLVKYNGMNVGSLSAMTANFQQLNAMRTEIVDAISDHYLVTFNVGGKDMKIAFRNYANAQIVFENDGKLYVEAGDNKPANLAQLRELIKKTLEDTKKVNVSHNGEVSLSKAGATYKINVKNAAWPEATDAPVKIGTVTVSLIPDDVTTAEPVTATADVYIRDSRSVYTVTYQAVANGTVYKTESFQVFYGDKTPATTIVNGYTGYTWDKTIEKTVTGDVVYTANLKMVTVTYYAKDNTVLATYQVPDGAAIPELENDPYEGTTGFKGWYQKEVEGNLNFYPAFTENHVATLYYNDRGTTGVLRFEIKDGKVDPAINAYAKHPAKGVSTAGIIMESGEDFDPNGKYTSDINLIVVYFADENNNGIKDGTAADPRYIYNVQIGKLNAEEELVFEVAETWTLKEEKYAAGELTTLPEIEYNPVYIGYAVDKWVVTLDSTVEGTHTYTIKPILLPDTNGNGIADKKEGTKLVIDAPNGCTVSYRINDEGEYEAVVSYKIGADTIESVIQISGLADDGWFMYQEGVTKVVASPAKSGEKVVWYVDDVKIDNTSIVAGYDKNYNAYNNATGAVVANQEIIERIMTVSYAEVPSLKFNDAAINAGFDPFASYENLEQTLYTGMVADPKPAYDADKIQIWYLSRNLDSDVQATIQLDGLKAYIETHYGAVLDLLPEGMEFPESLTVTLPAKQWTLVEESPARHNASAQAVADEFINRKIKEMENSKFSPDQLMTLAAELVSELTAEVENKALLNPFGTMYAGAPANLKVDYTTEKYKVTCGPEFVYFLDNRTQVDLGVIKDHIKLDYADFTDADLLANISMTAGGVKITDAKPELDRVAYYENMNAGTYTVTVSFSGDNKYKPAAESVTFTLEIAKVTPVVEVEEFVITADDNYNYAPTVTPENAPIIQIIAGIEAMEFALDENMALADDEVTATVYVKIPQVYAQFLDGQQLDGYPVVEMGKFYTREQLVDALEEYAAHRNLPGKDAVNTLNELLDMIPDVVDNLQVYNMGLNKVSYKIRVDSIESKVYPTEPGIYVNYAASMGYVGKLLESKGNEYADLFLNDNYELSDLPGTDWKDPDNLLAAATMKAADYGIIVYTPMIPVPNINPNNGGIQLYDGDVANAQNLFVYEYEEGVTRELEVAYNKAKLEGEEPYYYGLTTRLDPTTAVPSAPGVYIAAYTYTKPVQNEDTGLMEVLRVDSDAAVIVIKPTEADLTITGGSFEYDGESKFPQISVTDKNGNVLDDANKTIISGTVNVKELSSNITANDLYGAVNIDFPNHWTIPGLELPDSFAGANRIEDAWDYYRTTFLNKAANDKFTPSDAIDFLEFCAKKTLAASDKAMELFERIGANEYVRSALNKVNNQVDYDLSVERLLEEGYTLQDMLYAGKANYFDVMIEYLRPLEDLDDNVWITMQDLETLDYSATGAYLYLGVITDPDLAIGVGKGLVIIHSADDYIMHDTHVPYDGQPHSVLMQDTTSREDVVVILDRANDAKVAISTEKKEVIIEVDEALAQDLIDELNKILAKDEHIDLQLSLDSSCTVGAAYIKTEKLANKLTDRLIASVRARSLAHLKKDGLAGQALEFALDLLDEKLEVLYSKVLTKLQKIDTLENGTRIIVGDHLTFDLDAFEVTTIDLNADEVNIILDNDLFGALKKALEKEGYTLSKGSDGYIVTGYEKGDKALEKVINHVFDKLSLTANKLFDKTPYDTPAKLEAALAKLNEKLNTWKSALLDEVQKRDGMSDYTRIVINGKLPVEVGTYDFYGFDYDVARTTATLVIEPIYIEAVAGSGHKSYGTAAENPGATVNYYSYKTNPETLEVEKVPYTVQSVINAANLSYEVVVAENAAQKIDAPVGDYAVTFKDLTITESDRYVLVGAIDGVFTVEPTTFDVINVSEHTYNGTEQAVTYDIIDKLSGKPLSKDLFTISPVTAGIDAATYTFTVTAKDGSGYTGEVKVEWTIAPLAIDSLTATDLIYNGQNQNTTLTVKAGELDATYNVISGNKGTNTGTYEVVVQGTGNFTGELKAKWNITPAKLTSVVGTNLVYNGTEQTTTLTVKAGELTATYDVISGNKGTNAGNYTVTVTGNGNFEGTVTGVWSITPAQITSATVTSTHTYNGAEQTAALVVKAGDLVLSENDYTVTNNKGTDSGNYTATVTGTGNFTGSASADWTIQNADFTVEVVGTYTYDGDVQNVQILVNGKPVDPNEFEVTGTTSGINAGDYFFTVTAKADGNYKGEFKDVKWTIAPLAIDSLAAADLVYNATEQTTTVTVKAGQLDATYNVISGNKGTNTGAYEVVVQGTGNFTGELKAKWNITPAEITSVVATDVTYNGQQQTATVVVKAGNLVVDTYTITGNVGTNAGDYTVKVVGTGNFKGEATDIWTIAPAQLTSVEAADLVYNATEQTTTLVVKAGELTATYEVVSGASATNAGTYTVKVKGTGNFAGTAENTWTIDPAQITSVTATDKVYNGQDQNTTLSVMAGALEATYEVIEGTITGKNADTYTVKVKGTGNFAGEKETIWKITPAKLTSVVGTNLVYNGTEQTTTLTVKAGELTATYDVISGNKGTNAGNYTVTVTGNGNFEGTVTGVWTIDRAMISEVIATNSVYTDAEQTTTLTVKAGDLTATYDVVSGASATNAGTYTVKVVGTGNFAGEKETTWTIDPAVVKVVADDKTMKMNESIPARTYTVTDVSGHVDPAKLVVTLVTAPTQNSAGQYLPGEYDITVTAESTANWTVEVEKGTLTVEAIDFICWNVQTGVYYDDVSVALGEAISGQIVQMLKDAHAGVVTTRATMLNGKTGEEIIIVPAGVTFDLYGHYVQTKNLLSFGVVIDTVAAADAPAYNANSVLADNGLHSGGILIPFETTEAWTQLQPENADYIPVYDSVTGSYKFFEGYDAVAGADTKAGVDGAIDAHDIGSKSNSSQVVFRFRLLFKDLEAYTVINGTEKSGLKVVLNIEWGGLHGMKVNYTMSDDLVSQHAGTQFTSNRGYVMTFTVKGLQGLGSGNWISAQPTIATQSGVLNNDAATLTYNIP